MDSFDANKVLLQNIILKGAENHLYRIGLNLKYDRNKKRRIFYNPILIFSVNIAIVIKSIVRLLTHEENKKFLIIIGDFSHFLGLKTHYNVILIFSIFSAPISQLISYYNYKNGIKQTYLKVIDMMSGLISPKSIGLTNKEEIYKLMKKSKILFSFCIWNINNVLPPIGFSLNLLPFIINYSFLEIIIFGIPHSFFYAIAVHYTSSLMLWPFV
jgi:hypothetical protein